ncbi:MAG: serine hydrolase domain-containing protein [Promethearchaeota archaeon]|jgi:CubicO group peptidase (beta-lactamase class C family)
MTEYLIMIGKELIKSSLHLIDNWLDYQVYIKEIPGLAVGIAVEDKLIFKKEYGFANLEKKTRLTDQHLFRIASHSKLFTATAIMILYHEGKLSIDDKISKHLPWFKSTKNKQLEHIRIQHLLTHSSGITRDGNTAHWESYKFPQLEEIKTQFQEKISFFEPSETLKYSNFGYTLLGQIIEIVSKQSYQDFIQKRIFLPLGMQNTIVDLDETNLARHATGYKRRLPKQERKPFDHIPTKIMKSATGLSSTVEDLIKFYQAHLFDNDTLFPNYIKREMQRTQFKTNGDEWGLGFSLSRIGDTTLVGHGGSFPGFITRSGLIQDEKIMLVILSNAVDGPSLILRNGIIGILNRLKKNRVEFTVKEKEKKPDFSSIIGFYANDWGTSLYSQIGSKLVAISPGLDNPLEFFSILKHDQGFKFIIPKDYPLYSPGQPIEFIDDYEGGKILVDSHQGKLFPFKFNY